MLNSVRRIIDRLALVSIQEYSGLDIPWTKVALTKRFGNSLNLQIFLSPINAGVLRLLVKASRTRCVINGYTKVKSWRFDHVERMRV